MRPQERTPGQPVTPYRCRRDAVASQNLADSGSGDPTAKASQLSLDPGVAPRRIVASQLEYQLNELLADRRAGLSPLNCNQPPVPAQHRARGDEPMHAKVPGQQPDQHREQRTVGQVQTRLRIGPAQDRHFMAQYKQLNVLGRAATTQQQQPGRYPANKRYIRRTDTSIHHPATAVAADRITPGERHGRVIEPRRARRILRSVAAATRCPRRHSSP